MRMHIAVSSIEEAVVVAKRLGESMSPCKMSVAGAAYLSAKRVVRELQSRIGEFESRHDPVTVTVEWKGVELTARHIRDAITRTYEDVLLVVAEGVPEEFMVPLFRVRMWHESEAGFTLPRAASPCKAPPAGWDCTRGDGHEGPCAAVPK